MNEHVTHSERKGGCIAAGHPPAYSLRVNQAAQQVYNGVQIDLQLS